MNNGTIPLALLVSAAAASLAGFARAAPTWIGQTVERKGGPLATCTGPAVRFTAAYLGEADGSSPAVGDVYFVRFTFTNLGNCTGNFGTPETVYGFDPQFSVPERHTPFHNLSHKEVTHLVKCVMRDPMGNQSEVTGEKCVRAIAKGPTGRWFVDTLGGYDRYRWVVPAGHTLEVTIPVLTVTPVTQDQPGLRVNVQLMISAAQEGFDFFDINQPMMVANRPMLVEQFKVDNLGPTTARMSADFLYRFLSSEGFIQLEPAPTFDSIRTAALDETMHDIRLGAYWANLTPDTQYRWRAGILRGETTILGEYQTFRTPPASSARNVLATDPAPTTVGRKIDLSQVRRLEGACAFTGGTPRAAPGWVLLLGLVVGGLLRRERRGLILLLAASILLAACPSKVNTPEDPPPGPGTGGRGGAGGGSTPAGGAGESTSVPSGGNTASRVALSFLRAEGAFFTVPNGWQVNDASLKAWQVEDHHVITMSPQGKPDVVLGVRQFLKAMRPERAIQLAAMPAKVEQVIEDKKGEGEGLYAYWIARVTLDGKSGVMGMYSWATLGNEKGERLVRLAALLAPNMAELEAFGGIDNLRRIAYGQAFFNPKDPPLELSGEYLGAEGTGGYYNPYTGQSSSSGFGLSLTITGNQLSVLHYRQLATGSTQTSTAATIATGTFIRERGMIVPSWSDCYTEVISNGIPGGRGSCQPGWGATIHMIPRSDGSFLARMPGMENINSIDEPGTVVMRAKQ